MSTITVMQYALPDFSVLLRLIFTKVMRFADLLFFSLGLLLLMSGFTGIDDTWLRAAFVQAALGRGVLIALKSLKQPWKI